MKNRELFERERWKFEIVEDILFYSLKMMSFLPSKTNSFCSSYILFIYIWNRSIFDKGNWLISKRLGEQTTSTRPSVSQKDDRGNNTGDIPLINWWHFQWITLPQESTNTSPLNRLVSLRWRVTIRSTGWRSWRVLCGLAWSSQMFTYGNILHITHKDPITFLYLPHIERHPRISETLIPYLLYKERSLLLRDLGLLFAII